MIEIRERVSVPVSPEQLWQMLADPVSVASCIPGATLEPGADGRYQGTMKVKFGPTVVQFRGEAELRYDDTARTCVIEGRGRDGKGASNATAQGTVSVAAQDDGSELVVDGSFRLTGPLEAFARSGGVHVARTILADFARNVARRAAEPEAAVEESTLSAGRLAGQVTKTWFQALIERLKGLFARKDQ